VNPGWQQFPPLQQQQQQQQFPPQQQQQPWPSMPSAPPSYEEACKQQPPNYGQAPVAPPSYGYAPYMPQTAGYPAVGPYPPQSSAGAYPQSHQHPQQVRLTWVQSIHITMLYTFLQTNGVVDVVFYTFQLLLDSICIVDELFSCFHRLFSTVFVLLLQKNCD
jgi:hypothetical protein